MGGVTKTEDNGPKMLQDTKRKETSFPSWKIMAPRCFKMPRERRLRFHHGLKRTQDDPEKGDFVSKMALRGPKMTSRSTKMIARWPQDDPRYLDIHFLRHFPCKINVFIT